jgi:hypothetical protein
MGTAGRGIPDFEFDRRGDAFERQLQHVPITADEKPGRAALIRLSCGTCCSDEDGRADRPQNQSLSHSLFWYLRRGCIGASLGGGCRCAGMRSASAPCEEPGSPRPGSFAWLRRFRIPFGANPSWRKMRRKPLRPAAEHLGRGLSNAADPFGRSFSIRPVCRLVKARSGAPAPCVACVARCEQGRALKDPGLATAPGSSTGAGAVAKRGICPNSSSQRTGAAPVPARLATRILTRNGNHLRPI